MHYEELIAFPGTDLQSLPKEILLNINFNNPTVDNIKIYCKLVYSFNTIFKNQCKILIFSNIY